MLRTMRIGLVVLVIVTGLLTCAQNPSSAQSAPPALAGQSEAQQAPISDQDIQMLRKNLRSERKQVIAANLKLTDTEAEKFWPVYEQYITELVAINHTKYELDQAICAK